MYLNLLLLLILLACVGLLANNGLWSNALTFFNVMTAALLASTYWEPVADWIDKQAETYTYLWDFLAMWAVFAIAMIVFRSATDLLSQVKVRFKKPVDQVGGIFFALWTGWVLVCFTTMSLHTAPLGRTFLGGSFQPTPEARMFFSLAPDRRWLGFIHKMSLGPLRRGGQYSHEFDENGDFLWKYGERRGAFEKELETRVTPKGGGGSIK